MVHSIVTINEAVHRAKAEGYPVSECALRRWVKSGQIPVRKAGNKNLLFYPALIAFLECADGGDNVTAKGTQVPGIRRVEVTK